MNKNITPKGFWKLAYVMDQPRIETRERMLQENVEHALEAVHRTQKLNRKYGHFENQVRAAKAALNKHHRRVIAHNNGYL